MAGRFAFALIYYNSKMHVLLLALQYLDMRNDSMLRGNGHGLFSTRFAADFGACVMSFVLNYYMQFSVVVFIFFFAPADQLFAPNFAIKKKQILRDEIKTIHSCLN